MRTGLFRSKHVKGLSVFLFAATIAFMVGGCPTPPPPPEATPVVEVNGRPIPGGKIEVPSTDTSLKIGDIIVGPGEKGEGFLLRVTSVERDPQANVLRLGTEQASITEALQAKGVESGILSVTKRPISDATSKPQQFKSLTHLDDCLVDLGGTVLAQGDGYRIEVTEGCIAFDPEVSLDVEFGLFNVTHAEVQARGTLTGDFKVRATAQAGMEFSPDPVLIGGAPVEAPFQAMIGPLPVFGTVKLYVYAGIEASVEVQGSVESSANANASLTLGAVYNGTTWGPLVQSELGFGYQDPVFDLHGDFTGRVYVRPRVEIWLYNVVGPWLQVEPFAELSGDFNVDRITWELGTAVTAEVGGTVTVLGHNLIAIGPFELLTREQTWRQLGSGLILVGTTPDVPSGPTPALAAPNVSINADLDWGDAARATSYDVYFGTSSNPPYGGNTQASNWALGTLSYSTTYYWKVVAKNSAGSTPGPVWLFTTEAQPQQPPEQPSLPNPANGASNVSINADLDWADAARATSYDVYFGTSNPPPLSGNSSPSNWALGTLSYSTTYYWKVVGKNGAGSTSGPVWSFATDAQPQQPPEQPSLPNPANGASNVSINADLDWADAARATSYDVYFGTSANPPYVGNTQASNWTLGALSYSTTYYWKVLAKNGAGSTSGPVWSFTTQGTPLQVPDCPIYPTPANGATGVSIETDLDWEDCARATSYDFYFGTASSPPFIGNVPSSHITLGTLQYNTWYYWKILPKNDAGPCPNPVIWAFRTEICCPGTPSNPNPPNGATGVAVESDLDWADSPCTDSYDVYFGTSNPPPYMTNTPVSDLSLLTLNYNTTYYWKVVAVSSQCSTPGPVWSFTTISRLVLAVQPGDVSVNPCQPVTYTCTVTANGSPVQNALIPVNDYVTPWSGQLTTNSSGQASYTVSCPQQTGPVCFGPATKSGYAPSDTICRTITVGAPIQAADHCVDAPTVANGQYFGTTAGMANDPPLLVDCNGQQLTAHDVWLRYVAPSSGQATIGLYSIDPPPGDNLGLEVYNACGGTQIGCDFGSGRPHWVYLNVTQGTPYLIRASSFGDQNVGQIRINITQP